MKKYITRKCSVGGSRLVRVFSCSNTGSARDDPCWTSRKNSLELTELSSINKVSSVQVFDPPVVTLNQ